MSYDRVLDGHILNVVQTEDITEQSDLQLRLQQRGYAIPQATLSRRLKKLEIAKVAGKYRMVGASMSNLPVVLDIQVSEFGLIVLHTHPGNANGLGLYLDQKYVTFSTDHASPSGILGTIAGDDTLILIVKSKKYVSEVVEKMREEFPYLKR